MIALQGGLDSSLFLLTFPFFVVECCLPVLFYVAIVFWIVGACRISTLLSPGNGVALWKIRSRAQRHWFTKAWRLPFLVFALVLSHIALAERYMGECRVRWSLVRGCSILWSFHTVVVIEWPLTVTHALLALMVFIWAERTCLAIICSSRLFSLEVQMNHLLFSWVLCYRLVIKFLLESFILLLWDEVLDAAIFLF